MFDKALAQNIVCLIIENIKIIQKRTEEIKSAEDFTCSESGMILLDSVCMKLVAIGESLKNWHKNTNRKLLLHYHQIKWRQAMGMRDIIVHHYFDVDAEQIYKTLKEDIILLLAVLVQIKNDLNE